MALNSFSIIFQVVETFPMTCAACFGFLSYSFYAATNKLRFRCYQKLKMHQHICYRGFLLVQLFVILSNEILLLYFIIRRSV